MRCVLPPAPPSHLLTRWLALNTTRRTADRLSLVRPSLAYPSLGREPERRSSCDISCRKGWQR